MCDRFAAALGAAADALETCVQTVCGQKLPVRVWARGMNVRSNAPLLLAGACGKTPAQCAALVLENLPNVQGLTPWHALVDGFLECAFTEELVTAAAHDFSAAARAEAVNDSREAMFFEKCTLLRARSVLSPPKPAARLSERQLNAAADAMRRAADTQKLSMPEIARTARLLEERLDEIVPQKTRDDLYAGALFGALWRMMQKEDER